MTITPIIAIFFALFGLCIGSFLNVVIYRLPNNMSLSKPNSHCPNCKSPIKWYDNIPVLAYIFLRGKCRNCKQKISPRYMIIELLTGVLFVLAYLINQDNVYLASAICVILSVLIAIAFIDLDNKFIPDRLTIMLLALSIALIFIDNSVSIKDRIIGLLAVGGFFALFYYGCLLIKKQEGLGFGDVKLMAVCGLLLGWQRGMLSIVIASVLGSIIIVSIITKNKEKRNEEFPFAPYLVFGVLVSLLFGSQIISWYLSLMGIN